MQHPLSPAFQYFDRAVFAFVNAQRDMLPPDKVSHLIAMAAHGCDSLTEALDTLAKSDWKGNGDLVHKVRTLRHRNVLKRVRNADLHGHPLPVCVLGIDTFEMRSAPGKPVQLQSSHGVGVQVQFEGMRPKKRWNPKDHKHADIKNIDCAIHWGCREGELTVYDPSTSSTVRLLPAIGEYLADCQALFRAVPRENLPPDEPTADGRKSEQ